MKLVRKRNMKVLFFIAVFFIGGVSVYSQEISVSRKKAQKFYNKGYAAQNKGDIDSASDFYQQAVILDPTYAVVYNNLGIIYEAKGYPDKAAEYYLKCLEQDSKCLSAYSNLAFIYEQKGDSQTALSYWKKRVELGGPDDAWTVKAQQRIVMLEDANTGAKAPLIEQVEDKKVKDIISKEVMVKPDENLKKAEESQGEEVKVQVEVEAVKKDVKIEEKNNEGKQDSLKIVKKDEEPKPVEKEKKGGEETVTNKNKDEKKTESQDTQGISQPNSGEEYLKQKSDNLKEMINNLSSMSFEIETENDDLKQKLKVLSMTLSEEKDRSKKEKALLFETLGTAYLKAKLYSEAVAAYKKSLFFNAGNAKLYYYLGLIYQYKERDSIAAVECFLEYLELDPHGEYNEKAKDLLRILK